MRPSSCPAHGRLVEQLALGLLDDAASARAEDALATCPHCSSWWGETFSGPAFAAVDDAVGVGLAAASVPPRHRLARWWLAAAAALILALAGTVTWNLSSAPAAPPCCIATVAQEAFQPVPTNGSDVNQDGQVDASDLALALTGRVPRGRS